MQSQLLQSVELCVLAIQKLKTPEALHFMENASTALAEAFSRGNKVLIAGNGGSLCDAMHFAEELTGFFRKKRRALPAIALADPGHLSCTANDLGYEFVFSRSVEALGKKGDLFFGLSTSGNSANIIRAIQCAKNLGLETVALLGTGGKLKGLADYELCIDGFTTADRVQEAHMAALHLIIELTESKLFTKNFLTDTIAQLTTNYN